jgi:hypothetical protein
VKFVLIATAAALTLPIPAAAQSLDRTHEPVWHPAGKTPALVYRQRERAPCTTTTGHHQSGKAAMPAAKTCAVTLAAMPATPTDAAVAR